jgi:predicted GNAT family N-acyltransferase
MDIFSENTRIKFIGNARGKNAVIIKQKILSVFTDNISKESYDQVKDCFYGYYVDNVLVGFFLCCSTEISVNHFSISYVGVLPEFRNKKHATNMLNLFLDKATILLDINEETADMVFYLSCEDSLQKFYKQFGFISFCFDNYLYSMYKYQKYDNILRAKK